MFLDVIKRFKQTYDSKKIKFFIVGDGPLRRNLEDYAEQLGVKEDVSFLGWMKDLAGLYSQLDIVALTSLNEGTPVALIEAQAAGRPCVATNVGGVANVVEQGKAGFLVPTQDVERFVQSLINLLHQPELMQAMGEYGREKVKDMFNKERLFKDIENLYLQELFTRRER
jgi:glycosyltransferase involved in cell wall biosynthesis